MFQIEIYTSPTCGGCTTMKSLIESSQYSEITKYKTIYGKEGKKNLDYIKGKGIRSIPVIRIFSPEKEEFIIGVTTLEEIDKKMRLVKNES